MSLQSHHSSPKTGRQRVFDTLAASGHAIEILLYYLICGSSGPETHSTQHQPSNPSEDAGILPGYSGYGIEGAVAVRRYE